MAVKTNTICYIISTKEIGKAVNFKGLGFRIRGITKTEKLKIMAIYSKIIEINPDDKKYRYKRRLDMDFRYFKSLGVNVTEKFIFEKLEKVILFESTSEEIHNYVVENDPVYSFSKGLINFIQFYNSESIKFGEEKSVGIFNIGNLLKKFNMNNDEVLTFVNFIHRLLFSTIDKSYRYSQSQTLVDFILLRKIAKFTKKLFYDNLRDFCATILYFPLSINTQERIVNIFSMMERILIKYDDKQEELTKTTQLTLKLGFINECNDDYSSKMKYSYGIRSSIVHGDDKKFKENYFKYLSLVYKKKDPQKAEEEFIKQNKLNNEWERRIMVHLMVCQFIEKNLKNLYKEWFKKPEEIAFMKKN